MTPINFTANFIRPVTVKKLENKEYKPCQANFVELNSKDVSDLSVLSTLAYTWDDSFASSMYNSAFRSFYADKSIQDNKRFLAITSQESDFENLEPKKVLGLAECDNKKELMIISHLQTKPDCISDPKINNPSQEYKEIGSAMIDSIKKESDNKEIKLISVPSAVDFYLKQGFERKDQGSDFLIYNSPDKSKNNLKNILIRFLAKWFQ